ncbi:sensor histidine kinase KdpD [Dactylosporangium roseum]|uniref:histidine kinase n=1 Tax=Dactylosporangium roseum TaxID=47989 RepID=A0ABY5Z2T4_9ACTN|nr:ATP-binding protein [Dactylosporangium roseum]UWZ35911.1 sensor histidine kinase KdpD [Dactylosporangium roseum]
MTRGELRVYLGAAPGVGKTYKMLEEGRRRRARGTDVVVGLVETHGRPLTEALLTGLEVLPRRTVVYRGATFTELDVDAVIARRPEVALVDELAHSNVPTGKRWEDVERLLEAGITVLTTVNIQHLESVNDVVERITGATQRETVPDAVVRRAEQIELVDMTPEALRRRMAHGNIYKPDKVDAALGNYFRVGNLTALRELALLWLADKVDEQLDRYRAEHDIEATWEARERVVVALTGGPEGDTLIRRAARIAARTKGADLLAVHVIRDDGLARADPTHLSRQRLLVESLGGTYHQVVGADVPAALLDFARGVNATQLVLGVSRRGRLAQILAPGVGATTTAGSGSIDVHLVTHEQVRRGRPRPRATGGGLTRRRRLAGFAFAAIGLPLLTLGLTPLRSGIALPTEILAFLVLTVGIALVGGLYPALLAAVGSFLLLNYFFIPPLHRFTVAEQENLFALSAFVMVAIAVATVVDLAARRTREAARAGAEARTMSTLAGSVLHGDRPLPALLERVRESFGLECVTLLERVEAGWQVAASAGNRPCLTPEEGQTEVSVDVGLSLVLRGHPLPAADRRLIEAFAAHAAIALRQQRLGEQAAVADSLAEVDRLRTALLSAVSHDLRTPLASAKAAVGSLRSDDVAFSAADREELLATAEESLDKLTRLVTNLLDMSRLQAGALAMTLQAVDVADAVPRAVDDLGAAVRIGVPDDLPEVHADPALLERILVNVLANALRYSPADTPPTVAASEHAGRVEIRVVDHGPGIPAADRDQIFQPFQRLGDRDNTTGVGLGLALSRGLAEAMGGTLTPDDTPGGGLTMTLTLRTAAEPADPALLARLGR